MADTRQPRSHATQPGAHIILVDTGLTFPCVVKAMTESGAVVDVHMRVGIPNSFRLALNDGTRRACWVLQRKGHELSVAFTDWSPPVGIELQQSQQQQEKCASL